MPPAFEEAQQARPIFVLGASHRAGTTLVQRLINSQSNAFIWGEHGGALGQLFETRQLLSHWDKTNGSAARQELNDFGLDSFVANLAPARSVTDVAFRSFLREMFGKDPDGKAKARWGFKEVRYGGPAAACLLELFPQARIVFLVRDVVAIARSLAVWEADSSMAWTSAWTQEALANWASNAASVASDPDDRIRTVRFESLISSPGHEVGELAEFLDLPNLGNETRVLERKIHAPGDAGRHDRAVPAVASLNPAVLSFVESTKVNELRAALGYRDHRDAG